MEILRFEDSTSPAPKRKKSSKGYITLGFVAAVFGIGSAFATTTIAINGNAPIALGQGVTAATACDTTISIVPTTAMRVVDGPQFFLDTLSVSNVDNSVTDTTSGLGCKEKFFDLQIFDSTVPTEAYSCTELDYLVAKTVAISLPTDPITFATTPVTCSDSTISFQILGTGTNFEIPFNQFEADFSFITLVSRDPKQ